jgi:bifunctional DNA-binding transcriptional regulator/antitoxin component of YhaV-PrlF toxin-antitoxin module
MKMRKIFHIIFLLVFPFILSGCAVPAKPQISTPTSTLSQEADYKANFGELPPEYRERARKLGYKEGDIVSFRRDDSGNPIVLPPLEETKNIKEMKAKLLEVLIEKVCKKVEMPLNVSASLNPDDMTGHFTVRVKGKNLKKEFQKQAEQQGFKKDDTVAVRVDAVTWEAKVAPKTASFSARLIKVIPPTEPGGRPTFIAATNFDDLPPVDQKRAAEQGYHKGDEVMMQIKGTGSDLEIMPRSAAAAVPKVGAKPFPVGMRSSFSKLDRKDQNKARKLGYKEGDTIWKRLDEGIFNLVPATDVGEGPDVELIGAKYDPATQQIVMLGIAKFEKLSADEARKASALGYKPGDMVGLKVRKDKSDGATIMSPAETKSTIQMLEDIKKRQ